MARSRMVLAVAGILAAALVVGTALTAAVSLSGGFDRAADRADLPDVIVRFDDERREDVDARLGALANVASRGYRTEITGVPLRARGGSSERGAVHLVEPGRRGYAIVDGRDLRGDGHEVVVEAGVARAWDLAVGDTMSIGHGGDFRIVGIGLSPDNVAFPLATVPRVYLTAGGAHVSPQSVNLAMAWLRDAGNEDETLTQARAVSFGLRDLRFLTRTGVQVLVGQAAGIVIALLAAFSLVALATAGIMLGATARSEVARRLPAIGVQRAIGFSRGRVVAAQARGAALVAAPSALAGLAVGARTVRGPSDRQLAALNQVGPGAGLLWCLGGAWIAIVALVAAAAAWPAWRATAAPVASLLRGGELAVGRRPPWAGGASLLAGFAGLGARLAMARRARWASTVAVLGISSATLLLLLSLASLLASLRDDPSTLGKAYALTARLDEAAVPDVRRIAGVEDAAPRWQVEASAAYALGQPLRLIAFPRGAERFETPPLAEGRRRRGAGEAEVGAGLADALGLRPGATLAVALATGGEARFRVSGIVRSLENEGRTAYVRSDRLDALGALGEPVVAVRLEQGADRRVVGDGLLDLGARPSEAAAATTRDRSFLAVLATVLRVVALTVALVCLVVLVQALVLTVRERRPTIAVLRTTGAGRGALARVLAGACAAVLVPAVVAGIALEWLVLGPLVASLAAGYAGLSLAPRPGHLLLAVVAIALLGAIAVAWVGRRVAGEPVVAGLREEA